MFLSLSFSPLPSLKLKKFKKSFNKKIKKRKTILDGKDDRKTITILQISKNLTSVYMSIYKVIHL